MKTRIRTASLAFAVLAIGPSVATAGCGKYSIRNLKAMKAFKEANDPYRASRWREAADRYEAVIAAKPDTNAAPDFLAASDVVVLPSVREQFRAARAVHPFIYAPRVAFRSRQVCGDSWALLPSAAGGIDPLLTVVVSVPAMFVLGGLLQWAFDRLGTMRSAPPRPWGSSPTESTSDRSRGACHAFRQPSGARRSCRTSPA